MKKAVKLPLVLLLVAAFFLCDRYIARNNFIKDSDIFVKNDFEITQYTDYVRIFQKNGERQRVWDYIAN